ncbi:MAG: glycerol-3-phosphate 1-O-acyltransferase PlsY [Clostridia bacterium]|nr:glycerol-3-phosphate 1-O-acyltransferase PlsY [Clostridia bacterium]
MNGFINVVGNLFVNGIVASYFSTEIPMLVICYFITAFAGYILGSLNFAVIISRVKYHDDIRKYGSGNAGMTNMLRTYGKGDAALTFLGDALKTAFAIVIGMVLVGSLHGGNYVAGFFAMLGHIYPCFFGFKGGKGVVTAATTILLLDARIFLILIALFVIIVAIWRYISLGSVVCAMLYPMLVYASNAVVFSNTGVSNPMSVIFALIIAMFVIIMHRQNIERLMKGKESKISFKSNKDKQKKYSVSAEKNDK